jgi:hypothetical protein
MDRFLGPGLPPNVSGSTSDGFFKSNGMGLFGGIIGIIGFALLLVGNLSNQTNSVVKENYNLGGSLALILGVALALQNFGLITAAKSYLEGGQFGTVIIVLLTVIVIFTALFYPYARTGETMSFASIVLIMLVAIGIFAALYNFSSRIEIANLISRFLMILYYFLPYGTFTFGILTDILTKQVEFSPASFAGLTGVLLNFAVSKIFPSESKTISPFCEIPGLAFLSSNIIPQSMMFVLSTIAYIATYISRSDNGALKNFAVDPNYSWPAWALYFGIGALQTVILYSNGCIAEDKFKFPLGATIFLSLVVPLAYGGVLGAVGSAVLGPKASAGPPSGVPILGGASTTPPVATCSAGSSDGEFICESFENGKLKRTVLTE